MKPASLYKPALVLLLAAAVIGGHLLPGLDATGLHMEIRNALHVIAFAIVAAVIFEVLPLRTALAALTTLAIVAVLGISGELAQTRIGKEFDVADLLRDLGGTALYLCARIVWQWTTSTSRAPAVRFSGRLASVLLGALLFVPLAYWLNAAARVSARYPTILDFEGRHDSRLYQPVASTVALVHADVARDGFDSIFAEVLLLDNDWSGLKINPLVPDWSAYQYLTMRAAVAGAYESRVVLFLSDGAHPGYPTQHRIGAFELGAQSALIRFALRDVVDVPGRPALDLSHIEAIHIIARTKSHDASEGNGPVLMLDDIRLE